jgi:hypothetical protein
VARRHGDGFAAVVERRGAGVDVDGDGDGVLALHDDSGAPGGATALG